MVDTLKSAASFLKSKWNKDELTQNLNSAMNDDDCQASTTLLHQLANATYSIDDWVKIWTYSQEKLNSRKGIRINKALNVLQFLMKNGNEVIIKDMKEQIRLFRDLQNFTAKGENELRINSIRRKAKTICQMLNSSKKLEQERALANTINLKLGTGNTNNNYLKKNSNTNSKPALPMKSNYEGMSSGYQSMSNPEKQESNISKVTGMATNLVKGIANKIKRKQDSLLEVETTYKSYADIAYNNTQTKPQLTPTEKKQPSKLFDKLNVRKPGGITKTHSNNVVPTPKAVRSEIKSQPNIPAPEINFFQTNNIPKQQIVNNNTDLFSFDNDILQVSKPVQSTNLFNLYENIQDSKSISTTNNSKDIFDFDDSSLLSGSQQKERVKVINNSSNFDIFSFEPQTNRNTNFVVPTQNQQNSKSNQMFADLLF